MKTIAPAAMAAIEAGEAIVTGAAEIITGFLAGGIPMAEGQTAELTWQQNTFVQAGGNDEARMGIAFLDSAGTEIGAITWADFAQPVGWTERTVSAVAPADTSFVRIYQEMRRNAGSNNDGYIDAIELTIDGVEVGLANAGAEFGTSGWTSIVGGLDTTIGGSPGPYEGSAYFFGGAHASTVAYYPALSTAIRLWGGYGPISFPTDNGDEIFQGVGARGLAQQNAGAVGGVAQGLTLSLSGVEAAALELLDSEEIKRASVVLYRLIFASDGKTLLDAHVFDRGRGDTVDSDEVVGGTASIDFAVESAARGLGRAGGRMRADSDQRLIDADDGYFKNTAYAAQKMLYWGGKRPYKAG